MDKESQLLSRLAVNHLFLAQFEPFRAALLTLQIRNPSLARAILQTIVAHGARFDSILWSQSCSSPSLLTWLSTIELLQFSDSSSLWSFDSESLRLRAEFLLLVHTVSSRVSESARKVIDLDSIEKDGLNEGFESRAELLEQREELRDTSDGLVDLVPVLDRIADLGLRRLKPDVGVGDGSGINANQGDTIFEETEFMGLRNVVLEFPEIFDALCWNIQRQFQWTEGSNAGLAITIRNEEKGMVDLEEGDARFLGLILRSVQITHLDAMKESMEKGDVDRAISHIQYLHFDCGVAEDEYRYMDLFHFSNSVKAYDSDDFCKDSMYFNLGSSF